MWTPEVPTLAGLLGTAGATEAEQAAVSTHLEAIGHGRPKDPWYLKIPAGLGAWAAAFAAFLAVAIFLSTGLLRFDGGTMTVFGLGGIAIAVTLRALGDGLFLSQLSLALSGAGHMALVFGILQATRFDGLWVPALVMSVSAAVLYDRLPDPIHRFLSVLAVPLCWLGWICVDFGRGGIYLVLAACGLAAGWLLATRAEERWRPAAYALTTVTPVLVLSGQLGWGIEPLPRWPVSAFLAAGLLWLVARRLGGVEQLPASPRGRAALGVCLALAALGAPGVILAMGALWLGFERDDAPLTGLGYALLPGFLGLFYYEMDVTLLTKSGLLMVGGLVVLAARSAFAESAAEPAVCDDESEGAASTPAPEPSQGLGKRLARERWATGFVLGGLVLVGVVFQGMVASKQSRLASGQTVLLKLRPRDPRSLMQGDYMVLRYEMDGWGSGAREAAQDAGQAHGHFVLKVGADEVGRFARLHDGGELAAGEVLLRYTLRGGDLEVGARSFFFQEGTGQLYQRAEYGEFKVAPDGEPILVGLRDAQRVRIEAP